MNEAQVKNKFSSRKVELEIWGNYIKKFVLESLTRLNINHEDFLKIPPKVRVKDEQSFLEKAFHRFGKNYSNPLVEITDQVGIRFVVLLESSITIINDIISKSSNFNVRKDRDFLSERDKSPTLFDYESVHLLVSPLENININNTTISKDITCEVQIRTLLQHAYAELTHDLLYKPSFCAPEKKVFRKASRCMALLESTSQTFEETNKDIIEANKIDKDIISKTSDLAKKLNLQYNFNKKITLSILTNIKTIMSSDCEDYLSISDDDINMVESFFTKYSNNSFLTQPIILLILMSIKDKEYLYKQYWELNCDHLNDILIFRGLSSI